MYRILTIIAFLLFSLTSSGQFVIRTSLPGGGGNGECEEINSDDRSSFISKNLTIVTCGRIAESHLSVRIGKEGSLLGTGELIGPSPSTNQQEFNCQQGVFEYQVTIRFNPLALCEEIGEPVSIINLLGFLHNGDVTTNDLEDVHFNIQIEGGMKICCGKPTDDGPTDQPTGNNGKKITQGNIKIYPNPMKSFTSINGLQEGDLLMISNFSGQEIYSQPIESESQIELNLSDISSGVYIVRVIRNSDLIFIKKAIKL